VCHGPCCGCSCRHRILLPLLGLLLRLLAEGKADLKLTLSLLNILLPLLLLHLLLLLLLNGPARATLAWALIDRAVDIGGLAQPAAAALSTPSCRLAASCCSISRALEALLAGIHPQALLVVVVQLHTGLIPLRC
jgi:hypothetical protein